MKILLTGGAGFIGSHLAHRLCSVGHHVCVYDDLSVTNGDYLRDLNCALVQGDILDAPRLEQAMSGYKTVIHLAAKGNVIESVKDPKTNFETNVTGTLNVLEACRKNHISRILFSSTGGALMGDTPPPVDENSVPDPISPYGSSKLCAESYIKTYSRCYGIDYTIFRFGNVLGVNSLHKKGVVNTFYKKIKSKQKLDIYGQVSRDFIYVDDLVKTIVKSLEVASSKNEIFHLSSGVEVPIGDLAKIMIEIMGGSQELINYSASRLGEVEKNFAKNKKVIEAIGFRNSKSIREIITEMISYFNACGYQ
jgi:UDP-glucose 4-epimerase